MLKSLNNTKSIEKYLSQQQNIEVTRNLNGRMDDNSVPPNRPTLEALGVLWRIGMCPYQHHAGLAAFTNNLLK